MKNYLFIVVITLFYSVFTSCSADKAQPQSSHPIIDVVTQGTWKLTHYSDNGDVETRNFIDYIFTFRADNKLIASNGSSEVIGNWNITEDNGSGDLYTDISSPNNTDDTPNNPVDFNIKFDAPLIFKGVGDDWDIEEILSNNEIVLKDGNADDATRTDYVTFEKIPSPSLDFTSVITQGIWKIFYYEDHRVDQTANFTDYNFTFGTNGSILATNGTLSESGNWIITQNNSSNLYFPALSDDSPNNTTDCNFYFPASNITFHDIQDDWDIVFVSNNTIILKDEVALDPTLNDYIVLKKLP
ncbi:MAG: hypothetical protein FGM16_02260 [Flavobacterium sp.]|nr:hypothetical protein [Flavobacterium sp.]